MKVAKFRRPHTRSADLSVASFEKLADEAEGILKRSHDLKFEALYPENEKLFIAKSIWSGGKKSSIFNSAERKNPFFFLTEI